MKKLEANYQKKVKELYDPDYFFEHGMNPSMKNLRNLIGENSINGMVPRFTTNVNTRQRRPWWFRDITDFYDREMMCYSFSSSLLPLFCSTAVFLLSLRYAHNFLPVGKYGIRSVYQTQCYKTWGIGGVGVVLAVPFYFFQLNIKTLGYCWGKFYDQIIMQERNYLYELEKFNNKRADFHFADSPFSEESEAKANEFTMHSSELSVDEPLWLKNYSKFKLDEEYVG